MYNVVLDLKDRKIKDEVANEVYVVSSKDIDLETLDKLKDILLHTVCPNEAMFSTIEGFKSFNGKDTIIME